MLTTFNCQNDTWHEMEISRPPSMRVQYPAVRVEGKLDVSPTAKKLASVEHHFIGALNANWCVYRISECS